MAEDGITGHGYLRGRQVPWSLGGVVGHATLVVVACGMFFARRLGSLGVPPVGVTTGGRETVRFEIT